MGVTFQGPKHLWQKLAAVQARLENAMHFRQIKKDGMSSLATWIGSMLMKLYSRCADEYMQDPYMLAVDHRHCSAMKLLATMTSATVHHGP